MRKWLQRAREKVSNRKYFHLHLISDSTGETLITLARAAASQYSNWRPVEHVTSMVRKQGQLDEAVAAIDENPGIVLYTLVEPQMERHLKKQCRELGVPCMDVLSPVTRIFDSYLGDTKSGQLGAQHALDAERQVLCDAVLQIICSDSGDRAGSSLGAGERRHCESGARTSLWILPNSNCCPRRRQLTLQAPSGCN